MKKVLLFTLFLLFGFYSNAQCPNNNTPWQTTTPSCPGSVVATNCLFGGEYQIVNVIAGTTYTFSTCGTLWDTEITLYSAGGTYLAYNDDACGLQSSVDWTATFTGQVLVLVDVFPCSSNFSCAILTVQCCASNGPAIAQDCIGAITICNSLGINNNSNNIGCVEDLTLGNQDCLATGERQGTWYIFSPSSGGTIGFTITPVVTTDYDFAVWGPYPIGSNTSTICSPSGPPLRCSYAAPSGPTGCGNGAIDVSEGATGDRWVSTFNVTTDYVYLMYIDNFSTNGQAFNLTWELTNGASLDCAVLPVELVSFEGYPQENDVMLEWVTTSEQNVSHFEIQRSFNGTEFHTIGTHAPMGSVASTTLYSFLDDNPAIGTNYYRIRTFDHNNPTPTLTHVISVEFEKFISTLNVQPNPTNGFVQIIMRAVDEKIITIKVYDARGRILEKRLQPIQKGDNTITIDITNHPSGYYHLTMNENESVVAQGKFVKY